MVTIQDFQIYLSSKKGRIDLYLSQIISSLTHKKQLFAIIIVNKAECQKDQDHMPNLRQNISIFDKQMCYSIIKYFDIQFIYIAEAIIKQMRNPGNQFQMYQRLRSYQLHCQRLQNRHLEVPGHEAFNPKNNSLVKAKQYHKNKHQFKIESENESIMRKLIDINKRKPHYESAPNLTLPPIKQHQFQIPLYEKPNSIIAKKIIGSKPSISLREQMDRYKTVQERKQRISKFDNSGGVSVNRKKYIAQLLLLKKLKSSRILNPEI